MNLQALKAVMPRAPEAWLIPILEIPPRYGIDTPNELATFISQLAVESEELTRLEENLNYSAARLTQVWPHRFPSADVAIRYAHAPDRLANFVYAGRMGNGDEVSGDGARFKGRGPIQLTGRMNYRKCGEDIGQPLVYEPELLLVPAVGIESACWYWRSRDLDRFDDDADARAETKLINGGQEGIARRQAYLDKALKEFR